MFFLGLYNLWLSICFLMYSVFFFYYIKIEMSFINVSFTFLLSLFLIFSISYCVDYRVLIEAFGLNMVSIKVFWL